MTWKRDDLRRDKRNTNLVKLKLEHPRMTFKKIGRVFHITEQRAHQIFKVKGGKQND